jgi:hypothetical protein
MTMDPLDKLARAYARLEALRDALPESSSITERYVDEYHAALKHLSDLGEDVAEFSIPDGDLRHMVSSSNAITREQRFTADRRVARPLLLAKLNAVLSYFNMVEGRTAKPIGFKP